MSIYKIQEETLKGLGDSVRAITGSSDSMTPTIMKESLDKVAQDINQTTVTSADVSYGEIAYGKDGKIVGTSPFCVQELADVKFSCELEKFLSVPHIRYACNGDCIVMLANDCAMYSYDGVNFNLINFPVRVYYVLDITCFKGAFYMTVVEHSYRTLIKSTDGCNWVSVYRVHQNEAAVGEVCATNDKILIHTQDADSYNIGYSTDGESWSFYSLPVNMFNGTLSAANNKFFLGSSGFIAYSNDGLNWEMAQTDIDLNENSIVLGRTIYGNGIYINGLINYNAGSHYAVSLDGESWEITNFPKGRIYHATYFNGRFVTSVLNENARRNLPAISVDGINYESIDNFPSNWSLFLPYVYKDKMYYIGYDVNAEQLMVVWSSDGITWKELGCITNVVSNLYSKIILQNNNISRELVVNENELKFRDELDTSDATITPVDVSYGKIAYGADGKITGTSPFSSPEEVNITLDQTTIDLFSGAQFWSCTGDECIVMTDGNVTGYSYDGVHWNMAELPDGLHIDGSNGLIKTVAYGNGIFVAGGEDTDYNRNYVLKSSDGKTWTKVLLEDEYDFSQVIFANNMFLIRDYFAERAAYSVDGVSWTYYDLPSYVRCYELSSANNMFFLGGENPCYSIDGVNWSDCVLSHSGQLDHIVYAKGIYIGYTGNPYQSYRYGVSADGINWTVLEGYKFDLVHSMNDRFVVFSNFCGIFADVSIDGYNYTNTYSKDYESYSNHAYVYSFKDRIYILDVTNGSESLLWSYDAITWYDSSAYVANIAPGVQENIVLKYNDQVKSLQLSEEGFSFEGEQNTEDATITAADVSNGKVAYGKDGKIVGTSPIVHVDGDPVKGLIPISGKWYSVCHGNGVLVAVAYDSNIAVYSTDGIHWSQTELPESKYWYSVTYGNGVFVALATSTDVAAYSTDGIDWIKITLPVSLKYRCVCYSEDINMFVAIAYGSNKALYSTDGINWTETTMPASKSWFSVTYGNGKFVAVAYTTAAAYSTDGINWTETTLPVSKSWTSVCYGSNKFVAIASSANISAYSTDGINWTETTLPVSKSWNSICYGNNMFVAVSGGNTASNIAIYSINGVDWSQTELPVSMKWRSVCYSKEYSMFVAVAEDYKIAVYSIDGINWKEPIYKASVVINPDVDLLITADGTEFRELVISDSGMTFKDDFTTTDATISAKEVLKNEIAYGKDGKVIGSVPLSLKSEKGTLPSEGDYDWFYICYSEDKHAYVATGNNRTMGGIAYSTDAIVWNFVPSNTTVSGLGVCYGNGKFVIVSDTGSSYSENLVDWIKPDMPMSGWWVDICYAEDVGKYTILNELGSVAHSSDAINWVSYELPSTNNWKSICYGNGMYVAIKNSSNIAAYSTDGINWTETTLPASKQWSKVVYGDGRFVLMGSYSNMLAYSTDGIIWHKVDRSKFEYWRSLTYGNGKFIAMSSEYAIYSTDGITWTEVTMPESGGWYGLCYGDNMFVATNCTTGSIAYSIDGEEWNCCSGDVYRLENHISGLKVAADGCERHIVVENKEGEWSQADIPSDEVWSSVCYGKGKYVAVAYNDSTYMETNSIAYSDDGITWVKGNLPVSNAWNSVCFYKELFVALGYDNAAYSLDGVNWTTSSISGADWSKVCGGGSIFISVAQDGRISYSFNGMGWITMGSMPSTDVTWTSISYGNGVFVALATNTDIAAYSTNGYGDWSSMTLPASAEWTSICYGDDKFVAIAANSSIATYSTDGINWNQSTLPFSDEWVSICYGNSTFVATTRSNKVVYSRDGITWDKVEDINITDFSPKQIRYCGDKLIILGESGNKLAYKNWSSKIKFNDEFDLDAVLEASY